MQFDIDYLFNHPDQIRPVAEWIYEEFWRDKPGYSVDFFEARLREANHPDQIPLSLLAIADGHPAGTINLIANDDPQRPHLSPWLAALVVVPQYRRRGIGTGLVQALGRAARRLGYGQLFLGTDQPTFYARLGAEFYEQANDTLQIMRLPLSL
ncbi:MAG TPA: GNAT family N-acetyltransferase [Leptolyngbyaceae cyanobacterium M65_K2018_010]|nr:GNAT family N-acetyltransferase [Leptolyngbyaceae cyanobacterium M65_K2018_010]